MNNLIIYCHPNPASLNHAIKESVVKNAIARGHNIRVRNIYEMNFNPVLTLTDLIGFDSSKVPGDVLEEQKHVSWADIITIIHPISGRGMPRRLKGYIDRVLSYGFAYCHGTNGIKKCLSGKDIYIINTVGEGQMYIDKGILNAIRIVAENNFGFMGLRIAEHRFFPSMNQSGNEVRQGCLVSLERLFK